MREELKQVNKLLDYECFFVNFWNRFGTTTARSSSSYNRSVPALKQIKACLRGSLGPTEAKCRVVLK